METVNIILPLSTKENLNSLAESLITFDNTLCESIDLIDCYYDHEQIVIELPLEKIDDPDYVAESIANIIFDEGIDDFELEIFDSFDNINEITLNNNENFNDYFGILGFVEGNSLWEADYQGKSVTLNKPIRSKNGPKKFHVYVKNSKGNVVKVNFGDPDMEIKADDPEARKSFRARHNCENPGPKTKARYWSCKKW